MHWHEIASALFFVPLMALGVLTILQVALYVLTEPCTGHPLPPPPPGRRT